MEINKYSPFLLSLICLITGIYWQQVYAFKSISLLITLFILCVLLLTFVSFDRLRTNGFIINSKFSVHGKLVEPNEQIIKLLQTLACLISFFTGAFLLQIQKDQNLNLLTQIAGKKLNLIARIENKEEEYGRTKEVIKLSVNKITEENNSAYKNTQFNLLCYTQTPTKTQVGDTIELKDVKISSQRINSNLNENPTFQDYLLKENVLTTLFAQNLNYQIISSPYFSLKNYLWNKKNFLHKKLKSKLQPITSSLFSAIFLGTKKDKLFDVLKKEFGYWGISHYLARSGLHIILFILIWQFLLSFLPLPFYLKRIILLIICITYGALSWISISFIRAFCVFIFYEIGKLFNQQTTFMHLLTFLCLMILLLNPMQLFFLDFQLSFALTFALSGLHQITYKKQIS